MKTPFQERELYRFSLMREGKETLKIKDDLHQFSK